MAAAREGSLTSGSDCVFVEMAIDVSRRDPDRQRTLVCLMDGEQKLWDLQRQWLGRSVEILDFFHALKRVRDVSKVVKQLRPRLYALTVEAVIQRIQERVRENRVREDSGRPQLRRVA